MGRDATQSHPESRAVKPLVAKLLLLIILGSLTTIAIAWAGTLWGDIGPGISAPLPVGATAMPPLPPTSAEPALNWGATVPTIPPHWPEPQNIITARGTALELHQASTAEPYGRGFRHWNASIIRAGWPMRALRAASLAQPESAPEPLRPSLMREGIELPDNSVTMKTSWTTGQGGVLTRTISTSRRLPLSPLWLGFAINTALAMLVIVSIRWSFVAAKRDLRTWAGRCRMCGHPRWGLPAGARCPECGAEETFGRSFLRLRTRAAQPPA